MQFGSFRDLNKAKLAKKNIEIKYAKLLLETNYKKLNNYSLYRKAFRSYSLSKIKISAIDRITKINK